MSKAIFDPLTMKSYREKTLTAIEVNDEYKKEVIVREVREVGEYLLKNAEDIVGNDVIGLDIDIIVKLSYNQIGPSIRIMKNFIMEEK